MFEFDALGTMQLLLLVVFGVVAFVVADCGLAFLVGATLKHFHVSFWTQDMWVQRFLFPTRVILTPVERTYVLLTAPWRFRNQRMFEEAFGFDPRWVDVSEAIVKQNRVDTRLREAAEDYNRQCTTQEEVRAKAANPKDWMDKRSTEELDDIQRQVNLAKAAFWHLHGLAKKHHFTVLGSFRRYLTQPESRPRRRMLRDGSTLTV